MTTVDSPSHFLEDKILDAAIHQTTEKVANVYPHTELAVSQDTATAAVAPNREYKGWARFLIPRMPQRPPASMRTLNTLNLFIRTL